MEKIKMVSMLIGLAGAVIALVGWFGFQSVILLAIGTVLYIIETMIEWKSLNLGAKVVDLIVFGIGSIVSAFLTSSPWYVGGMIALAFYSLITGIIGLIVTLKFSS